MHKAFILRNSVECMCDMPENTKCKIDRAGLLKRRVCVSLLAQIHHSRHVLCPAHEQTPSACRSCFNIDCSFSVCHSRAQAQHRPLHAPSTALFTLDRMAPPTQAACCRVWSGRYGGLANMLGFQEAGASALTSRSRRCLSPASALPPPHTVMFSSKTCNRTAVVCSACLKQAWQHRCPKLLCFKAGWV